MDILMILLATLGVGMGVTFTGAAAKDGLDRISDTPEPKPEDKAKIKKFFKAIGLYLLLYACLNIITMIPIALGFYAEPKETKETIILINLILAGIMTWYLVKYKFKKKYL